MKNSRVDNETRFKEQYLEVLTTFLNFVDVKITDSFPIYVCAPEFGYFRVSDFDGESLTLFEVDFENECRRFQEVTGRCSPFTINLPPVPVRVLRYSYYPGRLAGYTNTVHVDQDGRMRRGRQILS